MSNKTESKKWELGNTKRESSNRRFPLCQTRSLQNKERMEKDMLCSDFSKDWFIFHLDRNGYKHIQPNHYDRYRNRVFNSYNAKRDEDDGLKWNTCHQGRHTLKSYLKDCGIPDTDADTVMGNGKEKSHGSGNI